jgi:DNA-binding GntR family transcriptional regulator
MNDAAMLCGVGGRPPPSVLSLRQEYQVSHRTAAHALEHLRDEGVITPARGLGYFVKKLLTLPSRRA